MASNAGVINSSSKRAGVSPDEYLRLIAAGKKYCWRCKAWHDRAEFPSDEHRSDGLSAVCLESRRAFQRSRPPKKRDPRKERARSAVRLRILKGKLPHPSAVPCSDCSHTGADRQHQYDHYLGYAARNRLKVDAVCTKCHRKRERDRIMAVPAQSKQRRVK